MRKPHYEWFLNVFPQLKVTAASEKSSLEGHLSQAKDLKNSRIRESGLIISKNKELLADHEIARLILAFGLGGAKIYKFAREFSEELAKVALDVVCEAIPVSEQIVCIEFPDHMRFLIGDSYAHSAYLYNRDSGTGLRNLVAHIPLYDESGNLTFEFHTVGIPIEPGQLFSAALSGTRQRELNAIALGQKKNSGHNAALVGFLMRAFIYLHSGQPDLRSYRAPRPKAGQRARAFLREHENQSTVDMTLVGFNFKKPTVYTVGETTVTGHFRWQPFGQARQQVKLIWIEPHTRKFHD